MKQKSVTQWFLVCLIAFGIMMAGGLLGDLFVQPILAFVKKDSGWFFSINYYFSFIGALVAILLYLWNNHKEEFKALFPAKKGGLENNTLGYFGIGIGFGLFSMAICCFLAIAHQDIFLSFQKISVFYLLASFLMVLIQSGTEEIISRGYIQSVVGKRYGIKWGILVSSLFFSVVHIFNDGVTFLSLASIFVIGIGFGLLMHHYKSIWICIAFHTMWNFTQGFIFGIPVSGLVCNDGIMKIVSASATRTLYYDSQFGVEGSITSLLINLVIAIFVLYQMKKKKAS